MAYRHSGGGGASPSPKRVGTGLPPPSPPITTTTTRVVERDAKMLERMLQQIDEVFCSDDDNSERQLRLQLLEERQMALRRLCEAALDDDEDISGVLNYPDRVYDSAGNRCVEMGIVSSPRSSERFTVYDDAAVVARSIRRSASRNGAVFVSPQLPLPVLSLPPRITTASLPETISDVETVEDGGFLQRPPPPPLAIPRPPGIESGHYFHGIPSPPPPPPPPPPSPLFEDAGRAEDRSLVEAFLVGPRHPYAAEEDHPPRPPLWGAPSRRYASGGVDPSNSSENFDLYEDEKLLKSILAQLHVHKMKEVRNGHTAVASCCSSSSYENETVDAKAPPIGNVERTSGNLSGTMLSNHNKQQRANQPGATPCEVDIMIDDALPTDTGGVQGIIKENQSLHKELEAQDRVLREMTHKTESLARHLVKSMRERTELQHRVERLKELLGEANSEIGRLKQTAESQSETACGAAVWRAAVHAKQRELLICEDELRRFRAIVENRIMQSENVQRQQYNTSAVAQVHSDLEELIKELGISHMRRREAEEHARRAYEELEAAQAHIELIDRRLSEAERAAAAERLREIQESLMPVDDLSQLSPSSLLLSSALPIPSAEDVLNWPLSARHELARLASHAEGILFQHSENDRHAELRLLSARREGDKLREKCYAYEEEVKMLEVETEVLQRERAASKLSEQRWMQQLLDVYDDSVLVADLLQSTKNRAEEVLGLLAALDSSHGEVKMGVESFVNNVVRDWDTAVRFLTVLQRMNFEYSQQRQQEKQEKKNVERMPLSAATKARKEFVLRAVEMAMARGNSDNIEKEERQPRQNCGSNQSNLAQWPVMRGASLETKTIDAGKVEEVGEFQLHAARKVPLLPPSPLSPSRPLFLGEDISTVNMADADIQNGEHQESRQQKKDGMELPNPQYHHSPSPFYPLPDPPSSLLPLSDSVPTVAGEFSQTSRPRQGKEKETFSAPQKDQSLTGVFSVPESEGVIMSKYKSPSSSHTTLPRDVLPENSGNRCFSFTVSPPSPALRDPPHILPTSVSENLRTADSVPLVGEKEKTENVLDQVRQPKQQKMSFSVLQTLSNSLEEIEDVVELIDSSDEKRIEEQKQQGSPSKGLKKDASNSEVIIIITNSKGGRSSGESCTETKAVNPFMKTDTDSLKVPALRSASDVKKETRPRSGGKGSTLVSTDDNGNDNEPRLRMFTPIKSIIQEDNDSPCKVDLTEKEEQLQKCVMDSESQTVSTDTTEKVTTSVMDTNPSLNPTEIGSPLTVQTMDTTQPAGTVSVSAFSSRSSLMRSAYSQVLEEVPPKALPATFSLPIGDAPASDVDKHYAITVNSTSSLGNANSEVTTRRRPTAGMEFPSLQRPLVGHSK